MKLKDLFDMQKQVELKLGQLSGIDEDELGIENIVHLRFVALQVKVGELANLTKCYKYNRSLENLPKNKILFRYLEGMNYLLSIGNKYGYNVITEDSIENINKNSSILLTFSEIYDNLTILKTNILNESYIEGLNNYMIVFGKYMNLAEMLEITHDEAYEYFEKLEFTTA